MSELTVGALSSLRAQTLNCSDFHMKKPHFKEEPGSTPDEFLPRDKHKRQRSLSINGGLCSRYLERHGIIATQYEGFSPVFMQTFYGRLCATIVNVCKIKLQISPLAIDAGGRLDHLLKTRTKRPEFQTELNASIPASVCIRLICYSCLLTECCGQYAILW